MDDSIKRKLYVYNQIVKNNEIIKLSRQIKDNKQNIIKYKKETENAVQALEERIKELEKQNKLLTTNNNLKDMQLSKIPKFIKRLFINKKELIGE